MRLFALALLLLGADAGTRPFKPSAPIDLKAAFTGDPAGAFAVTASAASPVDADVEVEVLLPAGVAHLGGNRAGRGRSVGLRVEGSAPDGSRREIFVRATVTSGGARLTRVISLVLNDGPVAIKGTPRRDGRGEKIREFNR